MWPGFISRRRRHMWVEFVVGSLPCSGCFALFCSVFFRVLRFSPSISSKTNISKFQFDQESGGQRTTMWMCYLQIVIYLFILFIYKTCFQNQRIFCRKKVNARWIQPRFGRKHIYLIQPCQNEKVSIRFNILN